MTRQLHGILGPITTAFDPETGDLAPVSFRNCLEAHLAAGLDGVVVCGSTGEAALLDDDERRRLVEWARPLVPDDKWLLAGAGAESTRLTIRRAGDAAARGADAVLVVAPHYYGSAMTVDALLAHYTRVADASPVPVVLYNIPKYAHFALDPDMVARLSVHENIIGIKDSSGDASLLGAYLHAQSESFSVLTGSGAGVAAALEAGARGGILAVALFAPALTLEVRSAFLAGDRERTAALQERLTPLARTIVGGYGVAGVKAALNAAGLPGGPVRAPLLPLNPEQRADVVATLRAAELVGAV